MSSGVGLRCVSKILHETLPSFLLTMLEGVLRKACRLRKSQTKSRVYDLVNCGPDSRFMAGNLIVHNCAYGAGAETIHETLNMSGVEVTLDDVKKLHREYWKLFKGVKTFESRLISIWKTSGGWVPSLFGVPLPIAERAMKDSINRFCQQSGHHILMRILYWVSVFRKEQNITMFPFIVDFHDETIWEVPDHDVERAKQAIIMAREKVNDELNTEIKFKIDPEVGLSLADFKTE